MAKKKKKTTKKLTKNTAADDKVDLVEMINSAHGAGAILSMDAKPPQHYNTLSTGSLRLNEALGVGGLPRGRIVEVYGPESSGKTTLALHVIADAIAQGGKAAFIDAEHALDIGYAEALGVNPSGLLVSQPDCGEQALEIVDTIVRSEQCAVVVVDSVAALTPRVELEGEMGQSHVGLQARLMSQALRKLVRSVSISDTLLLFINQTRSKIGGYGNPETTTGGNALKFYASIRLRIVRTGSTEQGGIKVANTTKVKVVKNKVSPPFREVEFEIEYGKGISQEGEIIDMAIERKLIKKSGSWLHFADGTQLAQGKENAKLCLRNDDTMKAALLLQLQQSPT